MTEATTDWLITGKSPGPGDEPTIRVVAGKPGLSHGAGLDEETVAPLVLLASASVVSGCSPIWASIDSDVLGDYRDSTEISCKYGLAKGWSVLGIPVTFATIGQARLNGGVDKVFGVETIKGVGLVSVTRLTVYGG